MNIYFSKMFKTYRCFQQCIKTDQFNEDIPNECFYSNIFITYKNVYDSFKLIN